MGLFGNKKIDQAQDKQLATIRQDLANLVKTCNQNFNNHEEWVQYLNSKVQKLEAHLKALEAEAQANKQRDAELGEKFKALGSAFSTATETEAKE